MEGEGDGGFKTGSITWDISTNSGCVIDVYITFTVVFFRNFLPFSPLQRQMGCVLGGGLEVGIYFVMNNVWWMGPIPRKWGCFCEVSDGLCNASPFTWSWVASKSETKGHEEKNKIVNDDLCQGFYRSFGIEVLTSIC